MAKEKKAEDKKGRQLKYDWAAIRKEYMHSEYKTVNDFMRAVHGVDTQTNAYIARRTRGWAKDKRELFNKGMEASQQEIAQEGVINHTQLQLLKQNILILAAKKLKQLNTAEEINSRDLRTIYDMIKIELGEPTTISELQGNNNKPLAVQAVATQIKDIIEDNPENADKIIETMQLIDNSLQ